MLNDCQKKKETLLKSWIMYQWTMSCLVHITAILMNKLIELICFVLAPQSTMGEVVIFKHVSRVCLLQTWFTLTFLLKIIKFFCAKKKPLFIRIHKMSLLCKIVPTRVEFFVVVVVKPTFCIFTSLFQPKCTHSAHSALHQRQYSGTEANVHCSFLFQVHN